MSDIDQIIAALDRIEKRLNDLEARMLSPKQIALNALSDINVNLGTVSAGEFRAGVGTPGQGFTGTRIVYPGVTYDGEVWTVCGVNNDEMMVGFRSSDGVLVAGGGDVILNADGIVISAGTTDDQSLKWLDTATNYLAGYVQGTALTEAAGGTDDLWYDLTVTAGGVDSDHSARKGSLSLNARSVDSDGALLLSQISLVNYGYDKSTDLVGLSYRTQYGVNPILVDAHCKAGQFVLHDDQIVFNDGGDAINFRIETAGNQYAVYVVDAVDKVYLWGADTDNAYAVIGSTGGHETAWNDQGLDIDFRIEGDSESNLIQADAAANSVRLCGDPGLGAAERVIGIKDASVEPIVGALPDGGVVLYALDGNIFILSSDGNKYQLNTT